MQIKSSALKIHLLPQRNGETNDAEKSVTKLDVEEQVLRSITQSAGPSGLIRSGVPSNSSRRTKDEWSNYDWIMICV